MHIFYLYKERLQNKKLQHMCVCDSISIVL